MQGLEELEPLYTIKEVASILRVDSVTVRRWIDIGVFDAIRLPEGKSGRTSGYRVKKSVLDKVLSNVLY